MTRKEFIADLSENFTEIDFTDIQGIIEARCMQTGEDYDDLYSELMQAVNL